MDECRPIAAAELDLADVSAAAYELTWRFAYLFMT